jgi:TonB-linked SusC/RagA family outer membrane protein
MSKSFSLEMKGYFTQNMIRYKTKTKIPIMRKVFLTLSLSFALILCAYAQQKISGIVKDPDGLKIPGVSVVEKGTSNGVITDMNGKYQLTVNSSKSIVQFTFIGMKKVEEAVNGRDAINVTLQSDEIGLEEVVVTALGIKREEKSLGYSVSSIKGDDLSKSNDPNMMNTLAGKVPGLVISQGAGGISGSSRVLIRGNTTISGDNQPLYVIDGVPMVNTNDGSTGGGKFALGYDMGDGASSINSDDIENISVLKGPSASALYGSLASNGVIMITMKKGTSKNLGIEFKSTTSIEKQGTNYDDVQTIYGQGMNGVLPASVTESQKTLFYNFGPRLDPNLKVIGWDGMERPYGLMKNNIDGFFQTGKTYTNSIAFSQIAGQSSFRLSYTNLNSKDIIPKTGMDRHTFNLSAKTMIGKKFTIDTRVVYTKEKVNNRPALADSYNNIAKSFFGLANNIDQSFFSQNYKTATGDYIEWGGGTYNYNPYWVINDMKNKTNKDRLLGVLTLNYNFSKALNFKVTGSSDQNYLNFENYNPVTTPSALLGSLEQTNRKTTTNQLDALVSYEKDLSPYIKFTARAGANYFGYVNDGFSNVFTKMAVKEIINPNSYTEKAINSVYSRKDKNSFYGILAASYKNWLYLDATVRRDASSTLPVKNNTYSYPSLSGSFVFTDAFKNLPKLITFGKFRASAAEVGSDTDPYMLDLVYGLYPFPFNGQPSGSISTTIVPNKELKPTRTRSFETGLAMKFFNNRVGFDFTYYTSISRDQINVVPAPNTSGYVSQIVNVGSISNKGVELALSGSPIKAKNFFWDVQVNFAKNKNNVVSLAEGLPFLTLASARWLGVSVVAKPGEPYGAIMGYNYQRDPSGNIILDAISRRPIQSTAREVIGNGTYDWTGGVINTIRYKGISLTASIDIKQGGQLFSMTNMYSIARGQSTLTLGGREEWIQSEKDRLTAAQTPAAWLASGKQKGYVPQGVIKTTDAAGLVTYTPNTQGIDPTVFWGGYVIDGQGVAAPFIYDASYIKLRDVTISYSLPKIITKKLGISALSVGLVARNPLIISKHIPNIDPDSNYYNGNGQGLELGSLPSKRAFGFNLEVKL